MTSPGDISLPPKQQDSVKQSRNADKEYLKQVQRLMNYNHIYQGDLILNKKKNNIQATQSGEEEKSKVKIKKKILKSLDKPEQ